MKKFLCAVMSVLLVCSLFCLSGCSEKEPIDGDTFRLSMEAVGCTVKNETKSLEGTDEEATCYYAKNLDGSYVFEFYVTETAETAHALFANNKNSIESSAEGASSKSSSSLANYDTFRITSGGEFIAMTRIDNTLLYAHTTKENKDTALDVLKAIGY